jgi:hypothetical protein
VMAMLLSTALSMRRRRAGNALEALHERGVAEDGPAIWPPLMHIDGLVSRRSSRRVCLVLNRRL